MRKTYKPDSKELLNLAVKARSGDENAQGILFRRFSGFISRHVNKFYFSQEDLEDLKQEGTIALYRAIMKYSEERGPFGPFCRLVIRRQINRKAEKIIKRAGIETAKDEAVLENLPRRNIYDTAELKLINTEKESEVIGSAKKDMTKLEFNVFFMFLEGKSYRDIAVDLDRSEKSIDNALRRAKEKART